MNPRPVEPEADMLPSEPMLVIVNIVNIINIIVIIVSNVIIIF